MTLQLGIQFVIHSGGLTWFALIRAGRGRRLGQGRGRDRALSKYQRQHLARCLPVALQGISRRPPGGSRRLCPTVSEPRPCAGPSLGIVVAGGGLGRGRCAPDSSRAQLGLGLCWPGVNSPLNLRTDPRCWQ